jgi:hypothetical protein
MQPKRFCGDVVCEGEKDYNNSYNTLQDFYINIDMTHRRSWTGMNLEIPDNIYWRVRKRLYTMGKDVKVKIVEDTLIPGKSPTVILGPYRTGKSLPCDYI